MKSQKHLLIITTACFFFGIACSTLKEIKGGRTHRYIYKGTTLYRYISDSERGDSVGCTDKTQLSALKNYLDEYSSARKFWKFDYSGGLYYVDMENSGWSNYELEDSSAKFGRMIVKTLILEGEKAGQEKVSMRMLILDTNINHKGLDYAPAISADGKTLYYVSNRKGSKADRSGNPSHDFWSIKKELKYDSVFSKPINIDTSEYSNINTYLNEGVATIAADGRTLFFTGCSRPDGYGDCDIYSAKIFEGKWSKTQNLGRNLNSEFWDSQPSVSPDGHILYFVSNRPGPNGENNEDIWYSIYDDDWEAWGPALNLSSINTKGKEAAPFIAADGITMFFSSDGYGDSFGGLDFYCTKYDAETHSWSKPAHLDKPLNSEGDDQFISMPASGDMLYISSRRQDIPGCQGDLDLFMAYVESYFRAIVLKIYVADDSHYNTNTFVTVDNPVSKRRIKDKTSEKDNILSMVLTNADYGRISDSIPYIDLKIQAENDLFGKKQKIMRVKNPLLDSNKGGWAFNNELDETFEMSVSPELDKYLRRLNRTVLDASVSAYSINKDSAFVSNDSIIIEEFQSTNTTPLLPYFFFNENSEQISDKYIQIYNEQTSNFSDEGFGNLGTLQIYYQLLNIIGIRLKNYPSSSINLTGCNANIYDEKGNLELSRQRAEKVKEYLVNIWGIDASRINCNVRNLPENPSNNSNYEGVEENRRVECSSTDERILAPVTTKEILKLAKPESVIFKSFVSVKGGEATWQLNIMQDKKLLKYFNGEGSMKKDLIWEINKENSSMPTNENPINIELLVKDKKRDKIIVAKGELPVKQISSKQKKAEFTADKRIDKYSLILFDFGKSALNKGNVGTIASIKENIKEDSQIMLMGYSDRIGNDLYNLKLSEKRAIETAKALAARDMEIRAIGEGRLLYNNDLPEGRFYCRTVEIVVETPIKPNDFGNLKTK
ncbi:MAG: OmpA family protein [Candidatus Kapabacteria bacterium]|nr:OmpA family protein [Candidatus Kapabacteria bacterium]